MNDDILSYQSRILKNVYFIIYKQIKRDEKKF